MPRFSSSKAVKPPRLHGSMLGPNKSSLLELSGAVNSLSCVTLSFCFSLTNYPIYPPSSSVNNDFVEVDELILGLQERLRRRGCRKTLEEVLGQLGSLSIPARPRAR